MARARVEDDECSEVIFPRHPEQLEELMRNEGPS